VPSLRVLLTKKQKDLTYHATLISFFKVGQCQ